MAVTRIKNNQIFDKTITQAKIADATLVGTLFAPNLTLNSNLTINGNLAVMGESSTISSTNTYVNDPLIVFNNGYTGLPAYDVGMLVNRNLNPTNTAWIWSEQNQQFEGLYTTESGGTTGVINNSGYTSLKVGNVSVVSTSTLGNLQIAGNEISALNSDGGVSLIPSGAGVISAGSSVVPTAGASYDLGSSAYAWDQVYAKSVDVNGAVITTLGGNVTITPPVGGHTVIGNVVVSGGSTFSGNVTSDNAQLTGGSINGMPVGNVTPSTGVFTSIVDLGPLTANGANAAISFAPTGTGTVTINPATAGTISNMAVNATTLSAGTSTLGNTTAASVNTGNLNATGGTISNATITSTPISGSTGSFTGVTVSGNTSLAGTTISGIADVTDTTQSTAPSNGALVVAGGVGVAKNLNVGGNLQVAETTTLGSIVVSGNDISSAGNVQISATGEVKVGELVMPQVDGAAGSVMVTDGAGHITLKSITDSTSGNLVPLGTPTVGSLTDNNVAIATFTPTTKVTDAVDQLNEILGKLVPPAPPAFPNGTLIINSLSSGKRMAAFTQTDNTTTGSKQLAGGTAVTNFRTSASYSTNTLNDVGPGESGTVTVFKNGLSAGARAIASTLTNNGTYGDLVISDNVDYGTKTGKALLFWNSFDAAASGTVSAGWNELYIADSAAGTTNTPVWYYDASTPGTPVVSSTSFVPTTENVAYSSSVPHYTSSTVWTATGTATRLSGDMYPSTDTFLTGTAGGQFQAPASVTYSAAGITTPLARNLYVSSGNAVFTTTAYTVDATGSSASGPSYTVNNSYSTGTGSSTPGGTVLTIKVSDTSKVNENNVAVGSFGSGGSASAVRVGGLAAGATPVISGVTAWNSTSALPTYEASVVAGIAKQDTTNYSVGYFPAGPDLTGQAETQYITFRIQRDAVSKFDISVTGKFSGAHVAIPGSSTDTTAAPTNGWLDATVSYGGAGVPGTGTGGNGSAGCALGGTLTVGSNVTQSKTMTFGTESSHNSTNNYIYVRFTLAAGDSITALSFVNPTH